MIPFILCFLLLPIASLGDLINVVTTRGTVQGFDHDFDNDTTQRFFGYGQMFLGIPYAKAPLGEKRFTLPEDVCRYNERGEVHNATYYRPRCWQTFDFLQPTDNMDEDCLYLNVMTPNISGNYPVMVYIHGGALTTGGADPYHWKGAVRNLVSRGVVVVVIQYRLGLIGFFTTFTERFPPNRGMYDQILALRWVNQEIGNFGGDAGRITIFGQSAGGSSVSDLSLSPLARGLFHQLILTSGSSMNELETIEYPSGSIHQDRARQICQINSTDWGSLKSDTALMNCLVHATPQELIAFDGSDLKIWNVAIDGAYMPDYPEKLAKHRPKYPALIGDMQDDGSYRGSELRSPVDISNVTRQSVETQLNAIWPYYDQETSRNLTQMMIAGFSHGLPPADDDHLGWAKLHSDINTGIYFDSSINRDVQWHRQSGNKDVWLFTLTHHSMLPNWAFSVDGWIPISHSSDLPYLWFYPYIWETYNASDADFAVADHFGRLWTDFAKNGELPYPKAGPGNKYFEIDESIALKNNWRSESNEVFNVQFPKYLGDFPSLPISRKSWRQLRKLGEKVVSKWNSMTKCRACNPDEKSHCFH